MLGMQDGPRKLKLVELTKIVEIKLMFSCGSKNNKFC